MNIGESHTHEATGHKRHTMLAFTLGRDEPEVFSLKKGTGHLWGERLDLC